MPPVSGLFVFLTQANNNTEQNNHGNNKGSNFG